MLTPAFVPVFFAVLATIPAEADASDAVTPSVEATEPTESVTQIHAEVTLGGTTMGPQVGALFLVRHQVFAVGSSVSATGLFSTKTGGGIVAGFTPHHSGPFRLDLLAEAGSNYHYESGELLSDDPGRAATIPYVGARIGFHCRLGSATAPARMTNGFWLFAQRDLATVTKTYDYEETNWLSDQSTRAAGSTTLGGQWLYGIAYNIGFDAL